MIGANPQISQLPHLLPYHSAFVETRDHQIVDVSGDKWRTTMSADMDTTVLINWGLLRKVVFENTSIPVMSEGAVRQVQLYAAKMLTKNKPQSVKNILRAMLNFARGLAVHPEWLPAIRMFYWYDLTEDMFDAWLTTEYQKPRKGYSAGIVRSFYQWGADSDQPCIDFSTQLSAILREMRLKGPASGELVASRDSRRGAYTRQELEMIFAACQSGKGTDQDRALTWTFLETAARPVQIYLLRNCDLLVIKNPEEEETDESSPPHLEYSLNVRMAKQDDDVARYQEIPLSPSCGRLLQEIRGPEAAPDERLFWWIKKLYIKDINKRLKAFFEAADLRSPRLPVDSSDPEGPCFERLPVTARRFRYSIPTDRIARGDSPENVQDLLGHKNLKTTGIYVETSPLIADEFQRATDFAIRPLVERMQGRVANSINNNGASISSEPSSRRSFNEHEQNKDISEKVHGGQTQDQLVLASSEHRSQVFTHHKASEKSKLRVNEMVSFARRKFSQLYPDQSFDAQLWDICHLQERPSVRSEKKFYFTTLGLKSLSSYSDPANALPTHFADVIKSLIVIRSNVSVTFNNSCVYAARHFWNFLITEQPERALVFEWGSLTENDLLGLEYFLKNRYRTKQGQPLDPNAICLIMFRLQNLVDFLACRGICRWISYAVQTASTRKLSTRELQAKLQAAIEKLPALGILEALADIYYRVTTATVGTFSDWVLIMLSAIAVLMLTGIRLGELVTLPFDCEIDEQISPAEDGGLPNHRYGLKYWVEKTRRKTLRIKWISPTAEPIVREAIARIKRLTAEARERARVLEQDPTRVPLPAQFTGCVTITTQQLWALLGRNCQVSPRSVPSGHGSFFKRHNNSYLISDVEEYLLARRVRYLYTISHGDGTVQKLSDSLLILFENQSRFNMTGCCKLLVTPIKSGMIRKFLSLAKPKERNHVFSAFGLTAEEQALFTNPHSFRHWLIHIAYQGGMKLYLILRYFAKKDGCDTLDYLHYTAEERDAYVPDELRMIYPTT